MTAGSQRKFHQFSFRTGGQGDERRQRSAAAEKLRRAVQVDVGQQKIMGIAVGEQSADLPFVKGLPIVLHSPGREGQNKSETQGQKAAAEDFFHMKSSLLQYNGIIA